MKYYYHATPTENVDKILTEGIKVSGLENAVFLTDDPKSAARFLAVRLIPNITVFKIKMTHQQEVNFMEESFDHSREFFKCRAWMYYENIPVEMIKGVQEFALNG